MCFKVQLMLVLDRPVQSLEIAYSKSNPELRESFPSLNFYQKVSKCLEITRIIVGVLCTIVSSILTGTDKNHAFPGSIGYGIWGGILIILAGLMGVISSKVSPRLSLLIGAMAMTLVSTCVSSMVFILGIVEVLLVSQEQTEMFTARLAFGITLVTLAFVESVLSGISSSLYCRAMQCQMIGKSNMDYIDLTEDKSPVYQDLIENCDSRTDIS